MSHIIDSLATLSTAEQFFDALGVAYDQSVINVSRLHILKSFQGKLDLKALAALDDEQARAQAAQALAAAYDEFAGGKSGPKTFKVFKDAQPGFVPLSDIRRV